MYSDYQDEYRFARNYLVAGESVLWRGKPAAGNLLTSQDVFMSPFSILWCGFAVFWTVTAMSGAGLFGLFGIPFICVGFYITVGRFIWTAYIRKRTYYVITTQKIIRCRNGRVDMLQGKNMPAAYLTVRKNDCGTIVFGERDPYYRRGNQWQDYRFSLENIPNAAGVYQLLSRMER